MHHSKSQQENIHVAGQVEICILPKFRNTPRERNVLKRALEQLTQVEDISVVRDAEGNYYLFALLDLGNPSPAVLQQLVPYTVHRIARKALQAIELERLTRVK